MVCLVLVGAILRNFNKYAIEQRQNESYVAEVEDYYSDTYEDVYDYEYDEEPVEEKKGFIISNENEALKVFFNFIRCTSFLSPFKNNKMQNAKMQRALSCEL